MRLRITQWISTTVRRRHSLTATVTLDAPSAPRGPPCDHERVLQVGDVLQSCYPESDDTLDDNLTALMLRLTVEPIEPPGPRKR